MNELIQKAKEKKLRIKVYEIIEDLWRDVGEWKNYNKTIQEN